MLTLHYHPGNASFTPHVLLHEIGAPFEIHLVDREQGEHKFYPERLVDAGNAAGAAQVRAHATARVHAGLDQIDAQLAGHRGPWLLGDRYSAVDPYAFMLCRWTRGFAERPARSYPHIAPSLQRLLARPAVGCTIAVEKLREPLV